MGKNGGLDYSLESRLHGTIAANVSKKQIPEHLYNYADTKASFDFVMVIHRLPIGLSMSVRKNGQPQNEIILKSGDTEVVLPRSSGGGRQQPALDATRESESREMRAHFVSIEFREYRDIFTDHGLLWLRAGHPAEAILPLTHRALALKEPALRAILDEAEKVVDEKVLAHFR